MTNEEAIKLIEEIATSLELSDRGIEALSHAIQTIKEVEYLREYVKKLEGWIEKKV